MEDTLHVNPQTVHPDLWRRELCRIVQSNSFARAGKLRQLVLWLGERAIEGVTPKPSEYLVGVEALGKPRDFDPSYDVSVRQLKRRMCARLAHYYSNDGRTARVRLICDRGFAVRFEQVAVATDVRPCLAVLPIHGDDSGLLMGSLSHSLVEAGGVQVISRAAVLAEPPSNLIGRYGVTHLVEGELVRGSDNGWDLSLRLLDSNSGVILAGLRFSGFGPVPVATLSAAAGSFGGHLRSEPARAEAMAGV